LDPIWLLVAFIFVFAVKQIGLPPLVGFLAAGFVLNAMGVENSPILQTIADYGVLLLLFSIGLKLKIKSLFKPEIWATASIHMVIVVFTFSIGIYILSVISFSIFADLDYITSLLIAFALSFSSTVFAVKILEEKGESGSPFGRIAIGILVIQDIFAVLFLTVSKGELPSIWSLALIAMMIIPRLIKFTPVSMIIDKSGHGELLVLLGILLPFGVATLFDLVGLKPDLGALIIGVLLSGHPKAEELSKAMLSFKDLFLVGFFLTIGLSGIPSIEALGIAILFTLLLPFKTGLFFLLLTRFKLRTRTSTLTSFSLSNYSEFGLIVGAVGVSTGWLGNEWLVIFAMALSLTFILASPLNSSAHSIYSKWHLWLQKFETKERLPEEALLDIGDSNILILGMGQMGTGAYNALDNKYGSMVLGIDYDIERIENHKTLNRNVIFGDATDSDFWERVFPSHNIKLIVLATADFASNMSVLEELRRINYQGKITATANHDDEIEELKEAGADEVFNFYAEAGQGFADHICEIFDSKS
jgi:predicted Kef-type K+ transport protein